MAEDQQPNTQQDLPAQTNSEEASAGSKERNSRLRQQVEQTKLYRRKLIRDWQVNVDYRRGKPFASQSDEDRIAVPLDWTLTKQKVSALFSQTPAVRINHPPQTQDEDVAPWVHSFEQRVNDTVVLAGVEAVMDEVLPDCINAAGIGIAIAAREAITEPREVPAMDLSAFPPELQQYVLTNGTLPDGTPVPMETIPWEVESRYTINRISPADFLWPLSFNLSDFDKAPWIGHTGRCSWPTAVQRFHLKESDKQKVLGDDRTTLDRIDRIRHETERGTYEYEETVSYDEIFYHENDFDPEAKSFSTIHHVVFVHGLSEPAVDEAWKGQQIDKESQHLIGALKYPIRVLTLAYITDDAIPPSDSAVARPPVDELNKSRSQMIQQRQHSMPARWVNTDRVDPTVLYTLMRGQWQGMIPIQGVGTNAIGAIERSAMPVENFSFDRIARNDAIDAWGAGTSFRTASIDTKAESDSVDSDSDVRLARERARVGKFFLGLTEILGGLLSIFEDPQSFGQNFSPLVSRTLAYSILADSTVLLDSTQRLKKLIQFVNFTAKSGWVDLEPVLKEIATLSGLDPNTVIKPPKPSNPVEPNISLRLTGVEDMLNPMALAFMIKSGQAPTPEQIQQAKQLIDAAVMPPTAPPMGPDGMPLPIPSPPPPGVGEANPNYSAMPRINRRAVGAGPEED